jgi:ribonuclease HI
MQKLDLSRRLANWAIELGQFDLEFVLRTAIKGQILADFLANFTNMPGVEEAEAEKKWVIYVDGLSTKKNGGAGVLLISPNGEKLSSSLRLEFRTTNNEAEYEAVIAGLGMALELGAESVDIRSNSQVIMGHIRDEFEAKGEKMKMYLSKVQHMQSSFQKFRITKIPREENEKADRLARIASAENWDLEEDRENIQSLTHSSISDQALESTVIEEVSDWRKELIYYLANGVLPTEKKYVVQLKIKAGRFTILNRTLYRRGFTLPLLKCVSLEEGSYILREAHEGIAEAILDRESWHTRQ